MITKFLLARLGWPCAIADGVENGDTLNGLSVVGALPAPPLAYQLVAAGFDVVLIASLACARYREAMFTSWDKNDPKDTRDLLELLKQGITMRFSIAGERTPRHTRTD